MDKTATYLQPNCKLKQAKYEYEYEGQAKAGRYAILVKCALLRALT